MNAEIGIPVGMLTGLAGQAILADGPLPFVWWVGAIALLLMSVIVMAYFIALSHKRAEEEWMLVVWSRPTEIKVTDDYEIVVRAGKTVVVPADTILSYNKTMDRYECLRKAEGVIYSVSPAEIMHNHEYFDLP